MAIKSHQELDVYQVAFELAMEIFRYSKCFPLEEKYSMTDQIRRASRSVCANISEAWRKRRYEAAFIAKLNDAEAEAGEVQSWLEFAERCEYLSKEDAKRLHASYDHLLGMLVSMIRTSANWCLENRKGK